MRSPLPGPDHRLRFARIRLRLWSHPSFWRGDLRINLFEACPVFIHITACMLARFLEEPSIPEASAASLAPPLPQLLPAAAKVAGRDSHALENSALARPTGRWVERPRHSGQYTANEAPESVVFVTAVVRP